MLDERIDGLRARDDSGPLAVDPRELDALAPFDPVAWATEIAGPRTIKGWAGALDPWQADVIRSTERYIALLCTRQAGKSTIAALKAAHRALYRPRSMVLVISGKLDQAKLVFETISRMIAAAEELVGHDLRVEDNKTSTKLTNGSHVVCATSNPETIRGFSAVDLLIEDEAAFVDDPVYDAVGPMTRVSKGQIMLLSTPNGQRGHFWKAWTGPEKWDRYTITADKVSRIAPEDIERDRREKGESYVRQEYFCEFVGEVDSVFSAEQIRAAMSDDVELLEI